MQSLLTIDLIATDPAVRNGQPCVAGTGLRVIDLAMAHLFHRRQPEEIAADYAVSLAQVYAALSYYYAHKPELDNDIRTQIDRAKAMKEQAVGRATPFLSR